MRLLFSVYAIFFESALYLDGKSICRAEVACQKTRAGAHTRGGPHAREPTRPKTQRAGVGKDHRSRAHGKITRTRGKKRTSCGNQVEFGKHFMTK